MADSLLNSLIAALIPIATLLLGYGVKALEDWLQHRRGREREREARDAMRHAQLFERRVTFQRQTLLDLQEVLQQLARAVGSAHHEDVLSHRATGVWGKAPLSQEVDQSEFHAQTRTNMLAVRVRDDQVRDMALKLKAIATAVALARSKTDSDRALAQMIGVFAEVNQRIGELLRTLDDEEAA
jgi:hypothetical protein